MFFSCCPYFGLNFLWCHWNLACFSQFFGNT